MDKKQSVMLQERKQKHLPPTPTHSPHLVRWWLRMLKQVSFCLWQVQQCNSKNNLSESSIFVHRVK